MTRKILQIGSSAGITIPKALMKKLGLKVGQRVELHEENGKVTLESPEGDSVDKELVDWTDNFIETHRDALNELADK